MAFIRKSWATGLRQTWSLPLKVTIHRVAGICLGLAMMVPVFAGGGEKKPARDRDVIYGRKDGLALTLDVFHPAGPPNGAAVVLVASGGFRSAASDIHPGFTAEFLKRG